MPKIGKVAGINNANDVFDAQRLFNKLKGRLTEIQKRVAFLEGRIEFVKNQKSVQANYNAITGAEVATGGAFGSGSGGSSSGGGGGGEETIPIGSDEVSASSSIVNRKYGTKVASISCTMSVFISDYKLDNPSSSFEAPDVKSYRHSGSFTTSDDEGAVIASLNYYMRSVDSDTYDYITETHSGGRLTTHPETGSEYLYFEEWDQELSKPTAGGGFFMYPKLSTGFALLPAELAQIIESNWVAGPSYTPLTTIQLELLALAKGAEWSSSSDDLVDEVLSDIGYEYYVLRDGSGEASAVVSGYFPTDIKIRYSLSMGSNVLSAELTNYWDDDEGGIHNHAETFLENENRNRTTGWISAGGFTTKGRPTNSELELEITDITLKG